MSSVSVPMVRFQTTLRVGSAGACLTASPTILSPIIVVRKNFIPRRNRVSPMSCRLCDPAEHVVKFHEFSEIHRRHIRRFAGVPAFEPVFPSGPGGREFVLEEDLYVERKNKLNQAANSDRFTLGQFPRLFQWSDALTVVKRGTLIR